MPTGLLYLISNIIHWNLHFTISLCPSQIKNIFHKTVYILDRYVKIKLSAIEENKMTIEDKEIKVDQYYSVNGNAVRITRISSLDVWYCSIKYPEIGEMLCDRGIFCSIAKEIKP